MRSLSPRNLRANGGVSKLKVRWTISSGAKCYSEQSVTIAGRTCLTDCNSRRRGNCSAGKSCIALDLHADAARPELQIEKSTRCKPGLSSRTTGTAASKAQVHAQACPRHHLSTGLEQLFGGQIGEAVLQVWENLPKVLGDNNIQLKFDHQSVIKCTLTLSIRSVHCMVQATCSTLSRASNSRYRLAIIHGVM